MLEATKSRESTPETSPDAAPVNPALAAEAKIARIAVTVFPLLVVMAGVAGYLLPGAFKPLGPGVPYLLGIIMFCMGLTLTPPDFASVAKRPWAVVLGIVAHYVIMPGAGVDLQVGPGQEQNQQRRHDRGDQGGHGGDGDREGDVALGQERHHVGRGARGGAPD